MAIGPNQRNLDDLARIFQESSGSVWRAVYVYTGGRREIAEEAVSEAFALAMESRREILNPLALSAYER